MLDRKAVEPDYEDEQQAAHAAGFTSSLISFEALAEGNVPAALRYLQAPESVQPALYRGWMLTPAQYTQLYDGLLAKKLQLVNSPAQYRHCHYLPESYHHIQAHTPISRWTNSNDLVAACTVAAAFGSNPVVVKDYVKSAKHRWAEACFIPNAADADQVRAVTNKFLELRGDALNVGLVYRAFEELTPLTNHSRSGMPLTLEFRLFFAFGKLLTLANYWEEGNYGDAAPDISRFEAIATGIKSNFFTMDVAQKTSGEWIIMELGDGQVAGLPDTLDATAFYRQLHALLPQTRF